MLEEVGLDPVLEGGVPGAGERVFGAAGALSRVADGGVDVVQRRGK
jgi:hypothetical protein